MILYIKNLLRKNVLLHSIFYKIRINLLIVKYFFYRKKSIKFQILIMKSEFNNACNFFKKNMLLKNNFNFINFCRYLSLCLRLKIFKEDIKLNKIIFDYNKWDPLFYIFFYRKNENKILRIWLKKIFKYNPVLAEILYNPEKFVKNESKFFSNFKSQQEANLKMVQIYIKEIIAQIYFNDLQSNRLYHFYALDHIINDYLLNSNLKKKKRLAIINLDPWTQSIGHFYYLDSFLKGINLGILDYDCVKFSNDTHSVICNKYLFQLYKKYLDKKFLLKKNDNYVISKPNMEAWRLKNKKFTMAHNISNKIQSIWYKKKIDPLIKIPEEDCLYGNKVIKKILGNRKWFCTLHVREPGFRLNDHLWLDTGRNAKLENYQKAINFIHKKGGYSIRLGQKRAIKFVTRGFYDYGSSKLKSDFLDIFLLAKGKFNIGTSSGLSFIPLLLGKYKNIFTNLNLSFFVPIPGSVGIPKLVYSMKEKKLEKLKIYHKFDPPFLFYGNENFKNVGYKLIENSKEDIFLLVKEFLNDFKKKNWKKILRKRKTFPLSSNKNLYTKNFIPLPKYFISKYKDIL